MAEATPGAPRRQSLFTQIALRLTLLALVFALLDVAIVVPMYANDEQALAEDFIAQQAQRADRLLTGEPKSQEVSAALGRLVKPAGVSAWRVEVFDGGQRLVGKVGDLAGASKAPSAGMLDWTQRETTSQGTRIFGVQRFEGRAGPHWIAITAQAPGNRLYWPVIGQELVEHVALPLIPLTLLLLLFNVQVVGRLLKPLSLAARQVDALDPSRMDARLSEPDASLTDQYKALLATEGVNLEFTPDGIRRLAEIAGQVNERTENIGARRLHTVLERLLEDVSYNASDLDRVTVTVTAAYVDQNLSQLAADEDLSRYIL